MVTVVRAVLVGIVLPALAVLAMWAIPRAWTDLPGEVPSHWQGGVATSFMPVESMVSAWLVGAALVAAITVAVTMAGVRGRGWSNVNRAFAAIGVGATLAVVCSLLAQLASMRGRTSAEAASGGAGIGVLVLMGVFVVAGLVAFFALPRASAALTDGQRAAKIQAASLPRTTTEPEP